MPNLARQVLQHAAALSEGASLSAKALLHLGNRSAVDQARSRLARSGELLRAGPGVYVPQVKGNSERGRRRSRRRSRNGPASAVKPSSATAPQQPTRWG